MSFIFETMFYAIAIWQTFSFTIVLLALYEESDGIEEKAKALVKADYKTYLLPLAVIIGCWLMIVAF